MWVLTGWRPAGHLIQYAEVQITIDGQGQGAGDRCGSHHQQMGVIAFFPQGSPLGDAEAVLFIHHDHLQIFESNWGLDQGMGADQDLDGPIGQPGQDFFPFAGGSIPDQQADFIFRAGKPLLRPKPAGVSGWHSAALPGCWWAP